MPCCMKHFLASAPASASGFFNEDIVFLFALPRVRETGRRQATQLLELRKGDRSSLPSKAKSQLILRR